MSEQVIQMSYPDMEEMSKAFKQGAETLTRTRSEMQNVAGQLADGALGGSPGGNEGVGLGPLAGKRTQHGLRQGAEGGFLHGHEVGAAQLEELDPVFEQPQIAVVAVKLRRVRAADVAAG